VYIYDSLLALRGWKREEINGIEYELNSILTEKWEGKTYRLVIQRERRMNGDLDLWEGEYTYRCILTNDYTSTNREIVEFYNLRGGKKRILLMMFRGLTRSLRKFARSQCTIGSHGNEALTASHVPQCPCLQKTARMCLTDRQWQHR